MKTFKAIIKTLLFVCILLGAQKAEAQQKQSIAVIGIDTKGITLDNTSMGNLVRLELEKANIYEVYDKYDVQNQLSEHQIDASNCFGKTSIVEAGNLLKIDKVLTGNVDKFGDKIVFVLRMIDIQSGRIENTNVMEYLNLEEEIQCMARISVNNLIGVDNDKMLVDLLVNYDQLVSSPKTTVSLNGPRMGAALITGDMAKRLAAPKNEGGYNMYPVSSIFGYQFEKQYLSSGDFQALVEFVGAFNGLESGNFIPSLSVMNGFRFNKKGWEFGLGPIFRFSKMAEGYWDQGSWNLASETIDSLGKYDMIMGIDNRGSVKLSTSLIIAFGKTFRSGYLNMPVNLYVVPKKEGTTIGVVFGFNIAKKK